MSPKKNNTRRRSGNTLTQLYVNQKEQQDRIKDSVRLIDSLKEKNEEIYNEKKRICKKYPISSSFFCNSSIPSLLRSKLNDIIYHNKIVISRESKKLKNNLRNLQRSQRKMDKNYLGGNKTRRNRRKLI